MFSNLHFELVFFALLPYAFAAPPSGVNSGSGNNAATSAVSQDTVTSKLLRPAFFARVAYCSSDSVTHFTCGAACDAVEGVQILHADGDQGAIPRFFIATDPFTRSVVVAHEGTNPTKMKSIVNDAELELVALDSTRFPNAPDGVQVHDGFQQTQGRTSDVVLMTVRIALSRTGYTRVLTTGHSLGAAIATLDALMLKLNLPSDVEVDSVVFGLPRVGDQNFANLIDSMFPTFSHVTNQKDPIPLLPPRSLGFQHPSGELHITKVRGDTATIISCPGQENHNCSDANSVGDSSILDHLGPYFDGIYFGLQECS